MPTLQRTLTNLGAKLRRTRSRLSKATAARNAKARALEANPSQARYRSFCAAATKVNTLECEVGYIKLQLDKTAQTAERALQQAKQRAKTKTKKAKKKPATKRKKVVRKKAKARTKKKARKTR